MKYLRITPETLKIGVLISTPNLLGVVTKIHTDKNSVDICFFTSHRGATVWCYALADVFKSTIWSVLK